MAENLVARVSRLISGSVNTLVDAVENATPEMVMSEAIHEVDRATDEVRHELGTAIANKHHARKRLAEATSKHEDLGGKIDFAVTQGRDDLAEAAIARQLDLEAQIPVLEQALSDMADKEKELNGYVAALNGRKHEMEEDLKAYRTSRSETQSGDSGSVPGIVATGKTEARADKAEQAFNRVMQNTTGVPGTASSDPNTSAKLAELEKEVRSNRIQERLAAAKTMSGKTESVGT